MATKEIKQKIILDGEKEYSAALKEANRNLKTLKSALKAETAELGANATEQQKAQKKAESLKKQIAEQEKVVQTLQAALSEVKEKYGDNEDAVAQWEQKVNNARTTLANMKNELDGTGSALDGVKNDMSAVGTEANTAVTAAQSLSEAFGKIGEAGGGIADAIEGALSGVASRVQEVFDSIWSQLTDLAARSNGIVDLAGYWGTDVNTIQKYAGAVTAASGTLSDLNDIVTKINSKASTMKREDWLGISSISPENYEDQWAFAMAVLDDMSRMDTKTRNETGFELFGKGATKAFDLLNDWTTVQENLDKFDPEKGGFGLTEEQTKSMSDLYDKINGMTESWSRLKDMVTEGLFGNLALDLTSNAQGILDSLLKLFNAETEADREAAIAELETNIREAFTRIEQAIQNGIDILDRLSRELQGSDDPTMQAIGRVLGGLKSALEWFTEDNMNNVIKAFEILAGFWITGKGLQMAAKVAEVAASLKTIRLFSMFSGNGGTGSTPTVTGGGTSGEMPASTGHVIRRIAPYAAGVGGAAAIGAGFAAAAHERNTNEEIRGSGKAVEKAAETSEELTAAFVEYVSAQKAQQEAFEHAWDYTPEEAEEIVNRATAAAETLQGMEGSADVLDKYSAWRQENGMGNMDWELPPEMESLFTEQNGEAEEQTALLSEIEGLVRELEGNDDGSDIPGNMAASFWEGMGITPGQQVTHGDIQNLNNMPALVAAAAASGTASGVSGIKVTLDGYTVGSLVAPYVSQHIARDYYTQ